MRPPITALLLILATQAMAEEQTAPRMARSDIRWDAQAGDHAFGGNCIVYTPPGFAERERWPLIVFLHGAGGKGNDIAKLNREFIPKMLDGDRVLQAIVICPQAHGYWRDDEAIAAFDFAVAHLRDRVDPQRIYLTGLSSGGGAAWQAGKARASQIAALAPMCTLKGDLTHVESLRDVPIWTFHNVHDPYCRVEHTRNLVAALRAAGNDRVQYTELTDEVGKRIPEKNILPNTHAHAWITAYSNDAFWQWLLEQRQAVPASP